MVSVSSRSAVGPRPIPHRAMVRRIPTRGLAASAASAAAALGGQVRKGIVAVGMSGGVDSSVAALLLKRAGFEVVGVHMQNWDEGDERAGGACTATEDSKDAQEVCRQLGIGFHRVSFVKRYWNDVFMPFLEGYEKGVTPNPDVLCNREIKFEAFQQHVLQDLGADYVATGHYARLRPCLLTEGGEPAGVLRELLCGVDASKDQSYFLSLVKPHALQRAVFPLGALHKPQVRELAREAGLWTAEKAESMGICFIGKRRLQSFLPQYVETRPGGEFVSVQDGRRLGTHRGAALYTVGQGARIGGSREKWFVVGKDMSANTVTVAPGTDHPALYTDTLATSSTHFNWIGPPPPELQQAGGSFDCTYRVRYRQPLSRCRVSVEASGASLRVEFGSPQRAVAVGQTVALYDQHGQRCLGGGIISCCGPSYWEQGKALPDRLTDWTTRGAAQGAQAADQDEQLQEEEEEAVGSSSSSRHSR